MKPYKNPKPVEVSWVDSSGAGGWHSPGELVAFTRQSLACTTTGYLIGRSKDRIIIASNLDIGGGTHGNLMAIPRFAVQKIKKLQ